MTECICADIVHQRRIAIGASSDYVNLRDGIRKDAGKIPICISLVVIDNAAGAVTLYEIDRI
jgi:hypothetical protein